MGKDERMHLRLDAASRKKLRRACELTGLDEPTALRACVQAFIEHIEEHGGIWLPLAIVPKSDFKEAGGKIKSASAGGLSSSSTRYPAPASTTPHGVNEQPPAKPSGPRARSTRGLHKMIEREKGKT